MLKDIKIPWIEDPKIKKPSVSLSLLSISFVVTVIAGLLQVLGLTESTSIFVELTLTTAGLYFGRNINFKGDKYGPNKNNKKDEKEEEVNQ